MGTDNEGNVHISLLLDLEAIYDMSLDFKDRIHVHMKHHPVLVLHFQRVLTMKEMCSPACCLNGKQ
eukprot:3963761-Ditylum_brightwellii.AAC.1